MMKNILSTMLVLCFFLPSSAQKLKEFTRQKKTQKEYLMKQIAALQVYIGYAQKGYKISKEGLDFIGDMKDGEFNLHKDYFSSLKGINPEVKRYYKVNAIIDLQKSILKNCAANKRELRNSGFFSDNEQQYVAEVFGRLLKDCTHILEELETVTTANKLELKDDERIKRIDALHLQMQDNYSFAVGFGNEAKLLAQSRRKEINDLKTSRSLNGIKN